MISAKVATYLLAAITLAAAQCENQPVGTFVPNVADCSAWYRCDASGPTAGSCGTQYSFNPHTNQCDWPENVDCFACPAEGIKNIAVAGTCNQFVRCANSHGQLHTCPGDLQFNVGSGECDLPTAVNCTIAFVCPNLAPGESSFHQDERNCSAAFECIGGVTGPIHRECIPQLHFNINIGMCDSPLNTNCTLNDAPGGGQPGQPGPGQPGPGQPGGPGQPPLDVEVDCTQQGPKPHPNRCDAYIVCAAGKGNLITCAPGMHYNHNIQTCDLPQSANCVRP